MIDAPQNLKVEPVVVRMPFSDRFLSTESINCKEPIVFHYTNAAGALGILSSGQLWSTLVYHMNDSQECKHAHNVAMQCAYKLLNGTEEHLRKKFLDELRSQLERISRVRVFAACFSEAPDLLSQWRGYAGTGGYTLGFSLESLRAIAAKQNLVVAEVIYKNDAQETLFEAELRRLIRTYNHQLNPELNRSEIDKAFWPTIQMIAYESVRIKSEAFSEEREWRIYSNPFGDSYNNMEFIIRNGQIVPILKINLENGERKIQNRKLRDLCIRSHRTSPGPEADARSNAISDVFQRHEIYWHLGSRSMTSLR